MSTKAEETAFPVTISIDGNWDKEPPKHLNGLTKREYFAGLAMQGLCADPNPELKPKVVAEMAVRYADALINELNK